MIIDKVQLQFRIRIHNLELWIRIHNNFQLWIRIQQQVSDPYVSGSTTLAATLQAEHEKSVPFLVPYCTIRAVFLALSSKR
jgi:hypothetical protein